MFSKDVLEEAIETLPKMPDTEDLSVIKIWLANNLRFNSEETRDRYANYIMGRMFLDGRADNALRSFARLYAGKQELREVSFYRFCKAEPLMYEVIEQVIIPAIAYGRTGRLSVKKYLDQRFPSSKSTRFCANAIIKALVAGGIASADKDNIYFSYRNIPIASFCFILHSEFGEKGIYRIEKIEADRAISAMLWRSEQILESLYELRNMSLLSKVSEIDNVRQFTTKWSLEEAVERMGAVKASR